MILSERLRRTREFLARQTDVQPRVGVILGSGLGGLVDRVETEEVIPYEEIPGFAESSVEGHAGRLVMAHHGDLNLCMMQGRYHYYEGHEMNDIVYPVRVMSHWGCEELVVSNASGAINTSFEVGGLAVITDHINFMGDNPLIGKNDDQVGPRFVDMTSAYSPELRAIAHRAADGESIEVVEGVYVASSGPTYETPAEIKMYRRLGGDLAGMSTVPEVIAATHSGMKVLGLSCITNMAAGISGDSLSHEEVIRTTRESQQTFQSWVLAILDRIQAENSSESIHDRT